MDTPTAQRRILVAGRNCSSNLCMARSLARAGYWVEVLQIYQTKPRWINPMRFLKPEAHSKYIRAYHSCVCGNQSGVIAEKLLSLAAPGEKTLLIPTCDLAASAADMHLEQLEAHYLVPGVAGKPGRINRLMGKNIQKELAEQAGLPVLSSCLIQTRNGRFVIPETVAYPCFVKPNVSKNNFKSHMCRCDSRMELEQALTRFSREKDVQMLVEEYAQIRREYALLGLSTKEGAVCPGFFVLEQGGHEERRGVTVVGRVLPCAPVQELIDRIAAFVHGLGYEGLFDVDLIETADGNMYFVELNLRYGASGYAITESGVNLPAMYAEYRFSHKAVDPDCRVAEPGKRFVSEKLLLDEYARDLITMAQVRQIIETADIHFIRDHEDPGPYRHFRKFFLVGAGTRLLFRLKRMLKS